MNSTNQRITHKSHTNYLSIQSSSIVVCNNSFRDMLTQLYDVETITFMKVGPLRKYTQEGVIKLKTPIPLNNELPRVVVFRNKEIKIGPIEEKIAKAFEKRNSKKLYLTGVNPHTTLDTLKRIFSQYGQVSCCKLMDRINSNGTKSGFALFEDRSTLDQILNRNCQLVVDGYEIYLSEYIHGPNKKEIERNSEPWVSNPERLPQSMSIEGKIGGKYLIEGLAWHREKCHRATKIPAERSFEDYEYLIDERGSGFNLPQLVYDIQDTNLPINYNFIHQTRSLHDSMHYETYGNSRVLHGHKDPSSTVSTRKNNFPITEEHPYKEILQEFDPRRTGFLINHNWSNLRFNPITRGVGGIAANQRSAIPVHPQ